MLKGLIKRGVPIDAVGMQCHLGLKSPEIAELDLAIHNFAALGLKVMITELDVDVLPSKGDIGIADISRVEESDPKLDPYTSGLPDEVQRQLAERYAGLFSLFIRHKKNITRVTFWGLDDGHTWLNHFPIRGRTNHPLLINRELALNRHSSRFCRPASKRKVNHREHQNDIHKNSCLGKGRLPIGYLNAPTSPIYPFGHGLSYTKFSYGNPQLCANQIRPGESITVSFDVTNTGSKTGTEVVQVYATGEEFEIARPRLELKGFARIALNPGETKKAEIQITAKDLEFHNQKLERVLPRGKYQIRVGGSSESLAPPSRWIPCQPPNNPRHTSLWQRHRTGPTQ